MTGTATRACPARLRRWPGRSTSLPNVPMTPHVSGWTDDMLDAGARLIAENIRRVGQGKPLLIW